MPFYSFRCVNCNAEEERMFSVAQIERAKNRQRCQFCEGTMQKLMSVPAIRTDTEFMAGSHLDDGLPNAMSRKLAYAKAKDAGVNIQGKKFHPGLCRRGVPFDPSAWYGGREEAAQKTEALGRCATGSVTHTSSIRDKDLAAAEAPYRISADAVKQYVNTEIAQEHGGRVTSEKRAEITEKFRDKHSGDIDDPGPVDLSSG